MERSGFVYIMASRVNGTIYIGVTSDLAARAYQHRNGMVEGFTRKHGCTLLVWYEVHDALDNARLRERQLKKWNRDWKLRLIEQKNPDWLDLYQSLF
ncbi:GIY-YIG nuclease family protein [Sphingomonas sp. KR1UV-12]|uniref:GIY-YIG nuclease family protein n=1 Tax=Sphingomonas aurea TaxID=3063994 RepID=A0ABT9EK80_9SPHN|nr:GIY-YIG nuclease family protein [Sphingomonas sp. KR1UV-12]MDP1027377.1 GIY-YIG nuclease family protein [Sphingomonas sp. KR1UV-12]